tara:strand:- start:1516 stop:1923 length:408 start_codon:yes stop_codon:yes gene_type:complete
MEDFMNELAIWNLLAAFNTANGVWFLGCIVAIWLGFRISNNIYNTENAPIVGKILGSIYCLTVSYFTSFTLSQGSVLINDAAAGFRIVAETQEISAAAQRIVDMADIPMLNPIQITFLAATALMQLAQIWMKKAV